MTTLLTRILLELEVPHTKSFSDNLYNEHPYRYTLYGIQQMLSRYNIKTTTVRLKDKEDLSKIDTPFLAEAYNDIVIVKQMSKDGNFIYDWYGQEMKSSSEDFKKEATGIIMQILPDKSSREPHYKTHKRKEYTDNAEYLCIAILFLSLLALTYLHQNTCSSIMSIAFAITNAIGAIISYLIVRKTLNYDSVLADKICQMSKVSTCNDILQSKASKIFNRYGWGEIGLGYFGSSAIVALISSNLTNAISFYSIIGMLFPVWSLWYQKFKAKMWCPLCLCILLVLVVEGVLGCYILSNIIARIDTTIVQNIIMMGLIYAITILVICKIVDLLQSRNEASQMKYKLSQIKYKPSIINTLLDNEKSYDCSESTSCIIFGNKNSNYKLTVLSNPYCQPCAQMHKYLQRLLDAGCQIQYVFNYFSEDFSNVNKLLIATYFKYGEQEAWNIFSEWYTGGKNKQAKFFPKEIDASNQLVAEEFERHEKWIETTGFSATPTLLLNGKTLPSIYNVEDIAFMVENGL